MRALAIGTMKRRITATGTLRTPSPPKNLLTGLPTINNWTNYNSWGNFIAFY
jgi:hypothetical protein